MNMKRNHQWTGNRFNKEKLCKILIVFKILLVGIFFLKLINHISHPFKYLNK